LGSLGKDIFDLRHILVDEKGRMVVDKLSQKKPEYIADWQVSLIAGSKVSCAL
jgi:hypothetical protein